MPLTSAAFRAGDVYIDYPQETVMFHYERKTRKVFRRFYGERVETEIPHTSNLYNEAKRIGEQITADRYSAGAIYPAGQSQP
jgi:hypothetical protein